MLTACKTPIHEFLTTLAHTYDVGFDGCIARWSIFEGATQDVSGMRCRNYQRHSMKHMNGRYERSTKQTGTSPTDYFNVLPSLLGRSELKNWQSSWRSTLSQDQLQSSTKDGASKIPWMRYCLHVQHYLPLSMSMVRRSYNSLTFL